MELHQNDTIAISRDEQASAYRSLSSKDDVKNSMDTSSITRMERILTDIICQ
jgi:hypothetical protein